ncbi:MAG: hypothetical protein KJ864_04305, partial [Candidatus Omnitrophica bacterium]|nr:hypothetical protein [Candidatus Omnitrophota bacterium]
FQYEFKKIAKQILDISSYAYQNHVPFFFYRPFLMCMFSEHELGFLQSISPLLFYSRCEINLGGDYHLNLGLTINPDLTCYPCPSVHIKGIKITSDTTREDIKQSFNESMTELCTRPLMDSCKKCLYFANYKHQLVESSPMVLNNKKACQGGCLRYKESFFVKDL